MPHKRLQRKQWKFHGVAVRQVTLLRRDNQDTLRVERPRTSAAIRFRQRQLPFIS